VNYKTVGTAVSIALFALPMLLPSRTYASDYELKEREETLEVFVTGSYTRRKNWADVPFFPHGTDQGSKYARRSNSR
jgi:hypothetical protein